MTIANPAEKHRMMPVAGDAAASRAISLWLWFVAALVLAMVIVGGATRLTESGLSITEWQPLLGAIPPMHEGDWLAAFEKYKQIPQYSLVNEGHVAMRPSRPSTGGSGATGFSAASSASRSRCRFCSSG